jgi:hypothetical protein
MKVSVIPEDAQVSLMKDFICTPVMEATVGMYVLCMLVTRFCEQISNTSNVSPLVQCTADSSRRTL